MFSTKRVLILAFSFLALISVDRGQSAAQTASTKRGLNYAPFINGPYPTGVLQNSITQMGTQSWYYNQTTSADYGGSVTLPSGSPFVPMVYALSDVNSTELNQAKTYGDTLLTFNEPDVNGISVSQALAAWPTLEATGMTLGAPGCSDDCDASSANSWLGQFMSGAASAGYKVGFITVHAYPGNWAGNSTYGKNALGDAAGNATAVINYLNAIHTLYPTYPIWLDEFALTWNNSATAEQTEAFLQALQPQLEALPSWFVKYAWWTSYYWSYGYWTLNQTDIQGNINPLGLIYNSLGTYNPPAEKSVNGGFESGDLTGWSTWSSGAGEEAVGSTAFSGFYGAYLGGGGALLYQNLSGLSPGTTYTMNTVAYMYTNDGGTAIVGVNNASVPITATAWEGANTSQAYQTIQFTTCSSCTTAEVWFWIDDANTWAWIDNVTVRAITE